MTPTDRVDALAGQHLVLVGMMGVGQDHRRRAGRRAARHGRSSTPTPVIEARTGRTVREIFAADGEAAFRALETEVLLEALAEPSRP